MKDKALSGLDTDISSILETDEPDEIKMQKYAASLKRFKSYSAPRSIKPVIQPKKDAKYEHLLERLKQLKQKQRDQSPVISVDQRSEIDELFDDKSDSTLDYNLNELFQEKEQARQSPDYNLNELFQEKEQARNSPSLDAWESLTSVLQETCKLGKPQKKHQKSGIGGLLRHENRLESQKRARPGSSIRNGRVSRSKASRKFSGCGFHYTSYRN